MKQQPELMSFLEWRERHPVKKRKINLSEDAAQKLKELALRILKGKPVGMTRKSPSKKSMPSQSPKPKSFASLVKRFKDMIRQAKSGATTAKD